MANEFITKANKKIWKIDTEEVVVPAGKTVCIIKVLYFPSAANDDLVIQHADGTLAIPLKAGASDASPVYLPFDGDGLILDGLKIATLDGGTAYIYLAG